MHVVGLHRWVRVGRAPRGGSNGWAAEITTVRIELADPDGPDARRLLEAHAADMAARYDGGNWAGVNGRKDLLWLAREETDAAVGCVALRELRTDEVEVKH